MKLTVTKEELKEKLSNIQNLVEKKDTMPILSHFLLSASKEKSYITATDLETSLKEPLVATVEEEGSLCIPARKLFEIVKEAEGDLKLQSDGSWLKMTFGKSKFKLACLDPQDFPIWPSIENGSEIEMDMADLVDAVEKTIYSAGESDTQYTLNGILFHLKPADGKFTVVGTNGHRMSLISKSVNGGIKEEKKVIIHRKAAAELKKALIDDKVFCTIGQNHILFKSGDIQFLTRLIEGNYPNYAVVIPKDSDKVVTAPREQFLKALRKTSLMSMWKSNIIKLEITTGKMAVSSSSPDMGEANDEVEIALHGEPLSVAFNADYLMDCLISMGTEKVNVSLSNNLSPAVLQEEGNDDYQCIVMPVRV